ncbi:unnamed protein product [Mytilus coruscus]|uniref:Zinc finger PHD-type domain-containing protein n=1 Tax=Mytilus coruscus TaxID=42192 RepID=A0A6J8DWP7_MYTCO|nr:unnamed protein product [Mytilus coruscus]
MNDKSDTPDTPIANHSLNKTTSSDESNNRHVKVTEDQDRRGLTVSKVIKVFEKEQHQYTITLYYTNCKFLVNGRVVHIFTKEDIPEIHKIIKEVVLNGNKVNLKSLNEKLEKELYKLSCSEQTPQDDTNLPTQQAIMDQPCKTIQDQNGAKCSKCKRNVQTRVIFCDKGQHWIHYRCTKLSESEIQTVEKLSEIDYYICKLCLTDNQTNNIMGSNTVKFIANAIMDSNQSDKNYNCHDRIQALLDEEVHNVCNICNNLIDTQVIRCSTCTQPCHIHCASYNGFEYTCVSCEINIDPDERTKVMTLTSPTQASASHHITKNPGSDLSQENCILSNSITPIPTTCTNVSAQDDSLQCNNEIISQNNYVDPETINQTTQQQNIDGDLSKKQKELKMSDLRQREQRLKKREEELKIREKLNEEMQTERIWLQSHVTKLRNEN